MRAQVSSLFLASLLAAIVPALFAAAGCTTQPPSPEALFHEVARLNGEGRYGAIWDLTHEDGRAQYMQNIDNIRETVRRNPDPRNPISLIKNQFHVSVDEFYRMGYVDLFAKENEPLQRLMDDAKILDQQADPMRPTDVLLTWETAWGDKFVMRCRHTDEGWWLVSGHRRL